MRENATSTDAEANLGISEFPSEVAPAAPNERVWYASRRYPWQTIALGVAGIIVVAQAGLMTYWFTSGQATALDTGTVTITSEPLGSPVLVDGATQGTTPFVVALSPGPHQIEVGSGFQLHTQSVTVSPGSDASLHIELRPLPEPLVASAALGTGGLQVGTEPPGARVWIDGERRGVAPLSISGLKAGEHTITVRSGNDVVNRTVTVQAGTVSSFIISMSGAGAFASGWLAVSSGVPVQILEKGVLLGSSESPRILVPVGSHELEFANAALGYQVPQTVQISAGRTTSIVLKTPTGTLHVNALPWAEVWIDGQRAGETPIGNVSLPIGHHELLFRHPELGERRQTVIVGTGAPARIGVDLRQ